MNRKEERKEGAKLLIVVLSLATLLGCAFSDVWLDMASLPSPHVASDGAGLAFGNDQYGNARCIYAILGGGSKEFLRYNSPLNPWDLSPLNGSEFWPGAALTSDRSDYFYALKGYNPQNPLTAKESKYSVVESRHRVSMHQVGALMVSLPPRQSHRPRG